MARTVLLPAARVTVTVALAQVSQEPVPGKSRVPAAAPLTVRVIGRLVVLPLAYRKVSVAVGVDRALAHGVLRLVPGRRGGSRTGPGRHNG